MNYFFALPLGHLAKHIHKDLLQPLQAVDAEAQLRWSPYENLHITLAYLGSLSGAAVQGGARARALEDARLQSVLAVAERIKPPSFKCKIENLGFFPDATSRILALHIMPCTELTALQKHLQSALEEAGISCDERPYKPHITLARLKHREHINDWQLPAYSSSLSVNQFALYASEPPNIHSKAKSKFKSKPKLYQKIAEFPLSAF